MDKRKFLKLSGALAAGAVFVPTLTFCGGGESAKKKEEEELSTEEMAKAMVFELPALPYAYNALEPYIDERTMTIHHDKHHAGYTRKLNAALEGNTAFAGMDILTIFKTLDGSEAQDSVRNNAGGYYNHDMFWKVMAPNAGGVPTGIIAEMIDRDFGSFDAFKAAFSREASTVFGSGWAWLCKNDNEELFITSTPNQDNPLMNNIAEEKGMPILCLDVWEHAYYLNYQNKRGSYIDNFFNVINWAQVERNLG